MNVYPQTDNGMALKHQYHLKLVRVVLLFGRGTGSLMCLKFFQIIGLDDRGQDFMSAYLVTLDSSVTFWWRRVYCVRCLDGDMGGLGGEKMRRGGCWRCLAGGVKVFELEVRKSEKDMYGGTHGFKS